MKIALWYHGILTGGTRSIDTNYACSMMLDQMTAVEKSGLLEVTTEFYIGINGGFEDMEIARLFSPLQAKLICHGKGATTEIHTLKALRHWLPNHANWFVLYFHMKGVSHPPHDINWRRRMEQFCIWGWQNCVADLTQGMSACGCHWLTPESNPGQIKTPMFGGNMWWARGNYLMSLPPLPEPTWENRYEAESWIGRGPFRPQVKDYCPGWPSP